MEAASIDCQREGALDLLARAHASRAHDASRGIESEVRIGGVTRGVEMIFALKTTAHLADPHRTGHRMQLTVAIAGARRAIRWMIRHVEFHHATPQPLEHLGLRA